jgi:hypothetical protein
MTPRRILFTSWLVFVLYGYPGYLMRDGADMLVDSRVGEFTDWHSPMMTEVWRIVEIFTGGPTGMLLLQSLLLLAGTYSIARKLVGDLRGAWVAACVLLFPTLIATNAVICPEAQLPVWLIGGFALLQSERFGRRVLGLALLVVAAGMRAGGPLAVLPIVVATFTWRAPLAGWRRIAVAVGAWVGVVALAAGINFALVDNLTQREEVRVAMIDITGVLQRGPTIDDARATKLLDGVPLATDEGIQARARSLAGNPAATGDSALFAMPDTQEQRDALFAARRAFIRAYPGAYVAHRWRLLYRTLGLKRPGSWEPVYTKFVNKKSDGEALHHAGHHSLFQRLLIWPVKILRNTPLFRPVYFLGLAIVLLGLAIWRRRREEILLLAGALGYELALMFTTTRAEFRDSHPMLLLTLFAGFLLLARARSGQLEARNKRVDE